MSKSVYLIEIDLDDDQDLKQILKEVDERVNIRSLASKDFDEYDQRLYYDYHLGA